MNLKAERKKVFPTKSFPCYYYNMIKETIQQGTVENPSKVVSEIAYLVQHIYNTGRVDTETDLLKTAQSVINGEVNVSFSELQKIRDGLQNIIDTSMDR